MLETHMDLQQLHRAATAYYLRSMRQEDIARELGISRPSVSKLLSEARRIGLVRFEVLDVPDEDVTELESALAEALDLRRVRIAPGDECRRGFRGLGDLLGQELRDLSLRRGDVLLISSGRTTDAVSRIGDLPALDGVLIAPTVGGQRESEPSFQTNEIVRTLASRTGADPRFIFAPALPSPTLWRSLQADPSFAEILELWSRARVLVTGIGAPYSGRDSLTSVVPRGEASLEGSVGDICLYFLDGQGRALPYPGSDLLVRPALEQLRAIPSSLALAAGAQKAPSIRAAARAGLITTLITDRPTAEAVLALS